jgi:hypothetical protein
MNIDSLVQATVVQRLPLHYQKRLFDEGSPTGSQGHRSPASNNELNNELFLQHKDLLHLATSFPALKSASTGGSSEKLTLLGRTARKQATRLKDVHLPNTV